MPASAATVLAQVYRSAPRFDTSAWRDFVELKVDDAILNHADETVFLSTAILHRALRLYVLHFLEVEELRQLNGVTSGLPSSVRTGDESVGYQQTASNTRADPVRFSDTPSGREYLGIIATRPEAHLFVL